MIEGINEHPVSRLAWLNAGPDEVGHYRIRWATPGHPFEIERGSGTADEARTRAQTLLNEGMLISAIFFWIER